MKGCLVPAGALVLHVALSAVASAQLARIGPPGKPLTAAQANAARQPVSTRISADGRQIAFVVRQADAKANRYQEGVYVVAVDGSTPMRRIAGGHMLQVVGWSADGQDVMYLADVGGGQYLWRVRATGGPARRVSARAVAAGLAAAWDTDDLLSLSQCAVSPDGRYAVFVVFDTSMQVRAAARFAAQPIVDTGQAVADLIHPTFVNLPTRAELWLHDLKTGRESRLWSAPPRPISNIPPLFAWSPRGTRLAVVYRLGFGSALNERFDRRPIVIIDVPSGRETHVSEQTGVTTDPRWSPDGRYVHVFSQGEVRVGEDMAPFRDWRYDTETKAFAPVGAARITYADFLAAADGSVATLARRVEAVQPLKLHNCTTDRALRALACIGEAPLRPPELVFQRLGPHAEPEGDLRTLTTLNSELATAQLGKVVELQWSLAENLAGSAGLVYPVGYEQGRRYPLVVMLYNTYTGRSFLATATFPNFPAQTFAGRGYAVLLMNVPSRFRPAHASFQEIKWGELGRATASIDSGIHRTIAMGIVDSVRIGIMGWSYGSALTDYLLWQWPKRFRAAASSEGGLYSAAGYWLTTRTFADGWLNPIFGGGPYGPSLDNWKAVSAVYHAAEISTPVLMEYRTTNIAGRELYTALRAHNVPAELVWYPNETHVLSRPVDQLASMQRHLDWFDFWLMDKDDPDPAKAAQYTRWWELRKLQHHGPATADTTTSHDDRNSGM